jgi:hypothetical protein
VSVLENIGKIVESLRTAADDKTAQHWNSKYDAERSRSPLDDENVGTLYRDIRQAAKKVGEERLAFRALTPPPDDLIKRATEGAATAEVTGAKAHVTALTKHDPAILRAADRDYAAAIAAHKSCLAAVQAWDSFVAGSTTANLLKPGQTVLKLLNVKSEDHPPATLTAQIAQATQSIAAAGALEATDPDKAKTAACAALATLPALKKACDNFNAQKTFEQQEGVLKVNEAFADFIVRNKAEPWPSGADKLAAEYKAVRDAAAAGDFILANQLRRGANVKLDKVRKSYAKKFDVKVDKFKEIAKNKPKGSEAAISAVLSENEIEEGVKMMYCNGDVFGVDVEQQLSIAQALSIYRYTTEDYQSINALRLGLPVGGKNADQTDSNVKQMKDRAEALAPIVEKALKKLPKFKSDGLVELLRGEADWPGAGKQYTKGNVFTIKQFWSTGVGFKFGGLWSITIKSYRSPRSIEAFSHHPNEKEVVFPPGTSFEVTDVKASVFDKDGNPLQFAVEVKQVKAKK